MAAGDQGAAGCANQYTTATTGIGVNGLASTPYNVAVGGTDFEDDYLNEDFQLLELRQRGGLVVGQIVYPGNSMEQQLRQPIDRAV